MRALIIFAKTTLQIQNNIRVMLLGVILLSVLYGCGLQKAITDGYKELTQKVKGEYYLDKRKYKVGMKAFQKETKADPESAEAQYYMGRFYLAENHNKKALEHFKEAVLISPEKADYFFWLGVANAANNKTDAEFKCYIRALELDDKHVRALTYLGHSQFERGEYETALTTYRRALEIWPENPPALYNQALVLKRLGRTPEERFAWKHYLSIYSSGAMARQAVLNLNAISDFDYRNQLIGKRTIPLAKIEFKPSTSVIMPTSEPTLDLLASLLKSTPGIALHIVTYQKNNKDLAEARAKSLKEYLTGGFARVESSRLQASWFGIPEEIKIGKRTFLLDETVKFITAESRSGHPPADLRTLAEVARAERRAEAAAQKTDLHAKATIEFMQMAGRTLLDVKESGDKEAISRAQSAYDAAVKSAEETVAEALRVSVETIRAMREEDMAWDRIAHELGVDPGALDLGPKKSSRQHADILSIGSGEPLSLQTEIKLATIRQPNSGLVPVQGLRMADGSGTKGFGL